MDSLVAPIIIFSLCVLVLGGIYLVLRPKNKDNPKIKPILRICSWGLLFVLLGFLAYILMFSKRDASEVPFSEFKSFSIQWGPGDSLVNTYDSKTGDYQFVDEHNRLVKMNVHLPQEELLYLHRKAAELGFWNWPSDLGGDTSAKRGSEKPLCFVTEFVYAHKSKKVVFNESFQGDSTLKADNRQMVKEIQTILDKDAQEQKK